MRTFSIYSSSTPCNYAVLCSPTRSISSTLNVDTHMHLNLTSVTLACLLAVALLFCNSMTKGIFENKRHDLLLEKCLILLLSFDEGLLEQVGICDESQQGCSILCNRNSLSLLPNLMARVWASGSPSETSAATFQTQLRSLPTLGDSFISGVTVSPYQRQLHVIKPSILP